MLGGWWWANPLQTFPQGPLLTLYVDPDPELDNSLVHFLSIYDDLMSHHVPSPPGYDVVMTEQVSGPKEPKLLGRYMLSVPYCKLSLFIAYLHTNEYLNIMNIIFN